MAEVQCPFCRRGFPSQHALFVHRKKKSACDPAFSNATAQPARVFEPPSAVQATGVDRPALFRKDQRHDAALKLFAECRLEKLMPATDVQFIKDELERSVLPLMRRQLCDKIAPHCPNLSRKEVEDMVAESTDLLAGLQTQRQEQSALNELLAGYLVEPRRRLLGTRKVKSMDAEGVGFGEEREVSDYCWDMMTEESIQRLLHVVPRALEEILATARRMDTRAQSTAGSDGFYTDIFDGTLYREHEVLGDEARRQRPCFTPGSELPNRLELSIGSYYDDCEPFGPLGAARVYKKLGCFYNLLWDLEPATRNSLLFIMPHTYAYSKDVNYWGPRALAGQPLLENWAKPVHRVGCACGECGGCTSLGASMERLNNGVVMEIYYKGKMHQLPVHAYLLTYHADFPAAAQMGPWMRGPGAGRPDRRTMLDTSLPTWQAPSSYLDANAHLPQKWTLRSEEQLAAMEVRYAEMKASGRDTAAAAYLKDCGINGDWAFDFPLRHFRHFKVTRAQVQDIMHNFLEGKFSKETAAFMFLCIRYGIFSLDDVNAVVAALDWERDERPARIRETDVMEGQAGDLPKNGCSMSWKAAQSLYFLPRAREVFEHLFTTGLAARRSELAAKPNRTVPQKKIVRTIEERLNDVDRAWSSYQALVLEGGALFAYAFTLESIQALDCLIWDHDTKFLQVEAYNKAGLWSLKNSLCQLSPLEALLVGPLRGVMCMRFEAMNWISKGFASSGNHHNILERTATMWSLTSGYSMRTGKSGRWGDTLATHQSEPLTVSAKGDNMIKKICSLLEIKLKNVSYIEVIKLRHLGQQYAPLTWVLVETLESWLKCQVGTCLLGYIERIVQVRDVFYMSTVCFPELSVRTFETGAITFEIPQQLLQVGGTRSPVWRVDELSISKLKLKLAEDTGVYHLRILQ